MNGREQQRIRRQAVLLAGALCYGSAFQIAPPGRDLRSTSTPSRRGAAATASARWALASTSSGVGGGGSGNGAGAATTTKLSAKAAKAPQQAEPRDDDDSAAAVLGRTDGSSGGGGSGGPTEEDKWMSVIKDFSRIEGGWQDVLVAVGEMRIAGVPISSHIYHAAMQTCCNQGQAEKALELFQNMREEAGGSAADMRVQHPSAPDKYCYDVAISACRRLKQPERAFAMLEEMKSFGDKFAPSVYTYTEVFRAFRGTPAGLQIVDSLLPEFLARQKGGGVAPRSVALCTHVLWLMAENGAWRRASTLLADMREQGVYPDRECYSAAISACCKGEAWREATRLLDQQRFEGAAHPQVRPDEASYAQTILACATQASKGGPDREEALGRALVVLKQMREAGLQGKPKEMLEVYRQLINACVSDRRQWERALDLFGQMRKACPGMIPGPIYRSIIHILSNSPGNRWREAHTLLEEARSQNRNLTTVTYNMVIRMLGREGELELAYSVFREMRQASKVKPRVDSYNQLLEGCAKVGDWRKALALLEEMGLDNLPPDLYSYRAAIAALSNGGEWERALALVARMARSGLQPNVHCYNAALLGCAKAGDQPGAWERAQALIEIMKREGPAPDVYSFNSLIEALSKGGQPDLALGQLDAMEAAGVAPDLHTMGLLLKVCQQGGRWQTALQLLAAMRGRGLAPNVICYTSAMQVVAEAGRVDLAEELLSQMAVDRVTPTAHTYSAAISAAARGRSMTKAMAMLAAMRRTGVQPDLITYSSLISACAKARSWERALELLEEARKDGLTPNLYTYTTAMSACSKGGQYERALELLHEMRDAGITPDNTAYSVAIDACEKSGRWQTALQLLEDMRIAGLAPEEDVPGAAAKAEADAER